LGNLLARVVFPAPDIANKVILFDGQSKNSWGLIFIPLFPN